MDYECKEAVSQRAVLQWFSYQYPRLKDMLMSYPIGFRMDAKEGSRMKSMGVRAGMPDLMLLVPALIEGEWVHALFIEMKREGGRLTDSQKYMGGKLEDQDYTVIVCYGIDDAKEQINRYLSFTEARLRSA